MRSGRLLSALLLLQAYGRLSGRVLADRLEVSARTVHRDMDALSAAGVPVFATRGAQGGWQLDDGWRARVPALDESELRGLLMAQPRVAGDPRLAASAERALTKLLAALPPTLREHAATIRQRLHVDTTGWRGAAEDLSPLPLVQDAVTRDRMLSIRYRQAGQAPATRKVHPLGLVAKGSRRVPRREHATRAPHLSSLADGTGGRPRPAVQTTRKVRSRRLLGNGRASVSRAASIRSHTAPRAPRSGGAHGLVSAGARPSRRTFGRWLGDGVGSIRLGGRCLLHRSGVRGSSRGHRPGRPAETCHCRVIGRARALATCFSARSPPSIPELTRPRHPRWGAPTLRPSVRPESRARWTQLQRSGEA